MVIGERDSQIVQKLTNQNKKLREEVQQLTQQIQEFQQLLIVRTKTSSSLNQVNLLQEIIKQKQQNIHCLEKALKDIKRSFLQTINSKFQSAIQFTQLKGQNTNLKKLIDSEKLNSSKLTKQIQIHKNSIEKLETQNQQNIIFITQLKTQKSNLINQIDGLKTKIAQLQTLSDNYKTKNTELTLIKTQHQSQIQVNKQLLIKLEEQKLKNIISITELTTIKEGLNNDNCSLKERNAQLQQQIKLTDQMKQEIRAKLSEEIKKLAQIQQKPCKYKQQLQDLIKKLSDKNTQSTTFSKTIIQTIEELQQFIQTLRQNEKKKILELQSIKIESQKRSFQTNKNFKQQKEKLQSQLSKSAMKIEDLEDQLLFAQAKITKLEKRFYAIGIELNLDSTILK